MSERIEWTKAEIESLICLPEHEQAAVIKSLTPEEKLSLSDAMMATKTKDRPKKSSSNSQREASRSANKTARAQASTVTIPTLSDKNRRIREQLEADTEQWIWTMAGPNSGILEPLSRKLVSQQSEMVAAYEETLSHGGDELILASRGEGKTTYLRLTLWKSISQGAVDFAAFIGATGPDATHSAQAIQEMVMRSIPYRKYYPEIAIPCVAVGSTPQLAKHMRATGRRFDNPDERFEQHPISFTWSADGIDMPDVPGSPSARAMLRFRGADSPIRGLNILGRRPKVVVMDDLDTPDTTGNPEVAQKVIDRVNFDIGGLGTQTEPLARIMLATLPKSGIGVAHHFAATGHPFVVKRFRYMLEKPYRMDLWMEYVRRRQKAKIAGDKYGRSAHRFYLANRIEMEAGAKVSNEHRFKAQILPDGSQFQLSAVQNYFDEWADKGEMFCRCEFDNETIIDQDVIESKLELGHVMNSEGEYPRGVPDETTSMMACGVDVRKIELHYSAMATDDIRRHRVFDYDVRSHGTSETTVEQAEGLILEGLHNLADQWERDGYTDPSGGVHKLDLTLIDKGWMGNWNEDGERKTWAGQPVETFCMQRGLRRYLPAKGAPSYRSPAASDICIVGDNWHMNRGAGAERACTEVIWNAEHWHALVAELFMLPESDEHRFELFRNEPGVWVNHKRLSSHVLEGSEELAERRQRSSRTRKPRFRRDHWWDSLAMMLVARSIEQWFRENLTGRRKKQAPATPLRPAETEELGAR